MTIDDLRLTKDQLCAIDALNKAVKDCIDKNIYFLNVNGFVSAYNGNFFHDDPYKSSDTVEIPAYDIMDELAAGVLCGGISEDASPRFYGSVKVATTKEVHDILEENGYCVDD